MRRAAWVICWRTARHGATTTGRLRSARRAARRERWDGAAALVARLREGRASFGQDWAVVRAPVAAAVELGAVVRPRVQIDRLPTGLEEFWDDERPWERA